MRSLLACYKCSDLNFKSLGFLEILTFDLSNQESSEVSTDWTELMSDTCATVSTAVYNIN